MTSVLNLDLGAGPASTTSLGGLVPMRRPAQNRPGLTAAHGWAHPYTGIPAMAVFYNDGGPGDGNPPAPQPVPSPADLAARGQQQPAPAPAAPQPVIDRETGVAMTQDRFNKIMTRQYEKSRDAAFRELAESVGLPYDPKAFDAEAFKQSLKAGQEARQQLLTDEQRRNADLDAREQAIAAREAEAVQRAAEAAARDRESLLQSSLVRLGAFDTEDEPNLQDALALLQRDLSGNPDADAAAVTAAAENIKKRRPGLFGTVAPQTLPPAPSGGPAGGNAPRQPASTKDAVTKAAHDRARRMGLRTDDAA